MRRNAIGAAGAICLVLLCAAAAPAQLAELKKTTPEERAAMITEMMKVKLGLTEAQLGQVREINLKYAQKMQPLLEGSEGRFREIWEMKDLNRDKEAELKGVLTPDQFQRYLAAKDEMRQRMEQQLMKKGK